MVSAQTTAAIWICLLLAACALPDTHAILDEQGGQSPRFENARGPLSAARNAAVLAKLKHQSGDIDILEKHISLEQAIVDSPLILGNKVTLLEDGAATYRAMFAAIATARDHINLESYIIEDDAIGQAFAQVLLAQQARGVQVNLIYDSVGGINTPQAFFQKLTEGGIQVLEFNPLNPLSARSTWMINNRDHRKLLIVDGRIAFIGGINISSVYSSSPYARHPGKAPTDTTAWRDTDLQIEGPVVAELQKLFLDTWQKQKGPPLAERAYLPPLPAVGSEIVRAIGSSFNDPYSLIYVTLISAITHAESRIHITQAYFVPDPQLLKSLTDAAERGVDVTLILPSHTDSGLTFHAGRSHYTHLLQRGVKIHERRGALLHAKTVVVDGVWSCIGSTNLDWRSFLNNDEINAVVLGRAFGQQMEAMFARDLAASEAIDLQHWSDRPLLLRLKELLTRLWQRLL